MADRRHSQEKTLPPPALGVADAVGIFLCFSLLLSLSYLRSRNRMFWGDEIMGMLTLRQPSYSALLHVWRAGLDSSGIWFYVFGRPWIALFGPSEVAIRLYSAIGISIAAGVVWISARRFYDVLPVAAAVALVFSSSSSLRWQLSNGRTYGLFMAASALTIYMLLRGEDEASRSPSPLFLLATFAVYTFLAGSHILGVVYVTAFLGIQLMLDLWSRRSRPLLYLAAASSLVIVLFSRANLQATAALGKPSFWTQRPTRHDLFHSLVICDPRLRDDMSVLLLIALLHLYVKRQRIPVYLILVGFCLLDIFIFAVSRITTSIYVDRYLMPFTLATIFIICELLTQISEAKTRFPEIRSALPLTLLVVACFRFHSPDRVEPWFPFPDYTAGLLDTLPKGELVIDTDVESFVDLEYYRHASLGRRVLYPSDWAIALDPGNQGGVSGAHEMDNFKTLGIYAEDIVPSAEALGLGRNFVVITRHGSQDLWLLRRIMHNPQFSAACAGVYGSGSNEFDIWQVHTL